MSFRRGVIVFKSLILQNEVRWYLCGRKPQIIFWWFSPPVDFIVTTIGAVVKVDKAVDHCFDFWCIRRWLEVRSEGGRRWSPLLFVCEGKV